jgi:integrase/recombinase XerD
VIELLLYCGLRRAEVSELEIGRVDLNRGEVLPMGKGGKTRRVPMPDFLNEHLRDYIGRRRLGRVFPSTFRGRPGLSKRGVAIIVARAGRRIGFKPKIPGLVCLNPHQLRHTFARRMKNAGMLIEDLARLLGHRDPMLTARLYGCHSFDEIREIFLAANKDG